MSSIVTDVLSKLGEKIMPRASSALGKLAISGIAGLEKEGPTALEAFGLAKAAKEKGEQLAAKPVDDYLGALKGMNPLQKTSVYKDLESGTATTPAAVIARQHMDDAFNEFVNRGLVDPSRAVKNYAPRMYDADALEGKDNVSKAIKHLVSTGQARNDDEALGLIRRMRGGGMKFKNIEQRRLANLPGYRTDAGVPADYLAGAYRRIGEHDVLGKNDENITDALSRLRSTNGDESYRYTKWMLEHYLGRGIGQGPSQYSGKGFEPWENSLSTFQALTKLGLSAISQSTQFVNIPVVTRSLSPMIRGFAHTMADYGDARELAVRAGSIFRESMHQARNESVSNIASLTQKAAFGGLSGVEGFLRIVASVSGKNAVQDSFAKLQKNLGDPEAMRVLGILGTDFKEALKRGALSHDDILTAARRASDISQFRTDVTSVPPAWRTSPYGRVVSMYKNFAFQQAKFMKDNVIKPALQGDMKPLMYVALLFPTVGEVFSDIKEWARKGNLNDRPNWDRFPADRILDNMTNVGVMGLAFDAARLMSYNNRNAFWEFLGGPLLSDAVDLGHMGQQYDASKSHPLDKVTEEGKKALTRRIPIVGPRLYQDNFVDRSTRKKGMFESGTVTKTFKRLVD